jgi:hypothetical protein
VIFYLREFLRLILYFLNLQFAAAVSVPADRQQIDKVGRLVPDFDVKGYLALIDTVSIDPEW